MKRLWVWLFGPTGSGFVEFVAFVFVLMLVLVVGIAGGLFVFVVTRLLGLR